MNVVPINAKKNRFFIFTPPRARSAWLANFLCWGPAYCFHEAMPEVPRVRNLVELFNMIPFSHVGMVDNGAAVFAKQIYELFPDAKYVVVDRPLDEVKQSLIESGAGKEDAMQYLEKIYVGLDSLLHTVPAERLLVIKHSTIGQRLAEIWSHCVFPLPQEMDEAFFHRAMFLNRSNIQLITDREAVRMQFLAANVESLFKYDYVGGDEVDGNVGEALDDKKGGL